MVFGDFRQFHVHKLTPKFGKNFVHVIFVSENIKLTTPFKSNKKGVKLRVGYMVVYFKIKNFQISRRLGWKNFENEFWSRVEKFWAADFVQKWPLTDFRPKMTKNRAENKLKISILTKNWALATNGSSVIPKTSIFDQK